MSQIRISTVDKKPELSLVGDDGQKIIINNIYVNMYSLGNELFCDLKTSDERIKLTLKDIDFIITADIQDWHKE